MGDRLAKAVFISWMPYNWRSEALAFGIGAENHFIHYGSFKKIWHAPFKYILQTISTFHLLLTKKPEGVLVATPPVFSALIVYLYHRLTGVPFVIDAHTGSFLDPKWRWSCPLHAFLSRRALCTIVTNDSLYSVVKDQWHAPAFLLEATLPELEHSDSVKTASLEMSPRLNIAVINTFSRDEPLLEVLEAARDLEDCATFYITGNLANAKPKYFSVAGGNVVFTNFLPRSEYVQLLRQVDAVMVLTTRDHTMLLGGYEAILAEKPLITSNWPILKRYFYRGTLYTDNTPADIVQQVRRLLDKNLREQLTQEMRCLKRERREKWNRQVHELRTLLLNSIHK